MEKQRARPTLEESLQDHHRLLEIQTRLAEYFAEGSCPAFNTWILQVRKELKEMITHLDAHFWREEDDCLHEGIAGSLPNATYRLESLLKEHGMILARGDALQQMAVRTIQPGGDAELRAEASEFFALLDRHERAERELFLLALEGEGGAPD